MIETSRIVVNTRTGESYITDSAEATLITSYTVMEAEIRRQFSVHDRYNFGTHLKAFDKELTYMASFGPVYLEDVIERNWISYEDTLAARVLYLKEDK